MLYLQEYDQTADFGPKIPCLFILMEYANRYILPFANELSTGHLLSAVCSGSLEDYISKISKSKRFIYAWRWSCGFLCGSCLCKGLLYLHHCGLISNQVSWHFILSKFSKFVSTYLYFVAGNLPLHRSYDVELNAQVYLFYYLSMNLFLNFHYSYAQKMKR